MTQQERSRKAREKWHDRMPVVVPPDKYDLWLDPDVTGFEAIRDILKPYGDVRHSHPGETVLGGLVLS